MKSIQPLWETAYNFQYSNHSIIQSKLRRIRHKDIQLGLCCSESFFKQGLVFHVVKNNLIPKVLSDKQANRIRGLVIIMAGDEARLITCYRSNTALKKIKQKSCRLKSEKSISFYNIASMLVSH